MQRGLTIKFDNEFAIECARRYMKISIYFAQSVILLKSTHIQVCCQRNGSILLVYDVFMFKIFHVQRRHSIVVSFYIIFSTFSFYICANITAFIQ